MRELLCYFLYYFLRKHKKYVQLSVVPYESKRKKNKIKKLAIELTYAVSTCPKNGNFRRLSRLFRKNSLSFWRCLDQKVYVCEYFYRIAREILRNIQKNGQCSSTQKKISKNHFSRCNCVYAITERPVWTKWGKMSSSIIKNTSKVSSKKKTKICSILEILLKLVWIVWIDCWFIMQF